MDEAYYDNLMSDRAHAVLGVPPWLRALDYTDDITGLYAIVNLEPIFCNSRARDEVCLLCNYGTMQIVGSKPLMSTNLATRLTLDHFYRYIKNGKIRMRIETSTSFMLSDRTWVIQCMYRLHDTVNKKELSKLYVGMMHVTPSSSQTSYIPSIPSNTELVADVTGDIEHVDMCKAAGVFKVKNQLTSVQTLVGKPHVTSESGFFGRFVGKAKNKSEVTLTKEKTNVDTKDVLERLGVYNKLEQNRDRDDD